MKPASTQQTQTTHLYAVPAVTSLADLWYDCQDVLQQLHISKRTLQKWRSNGIIPYSRIGRKIYYLKSDILEMLQKRKNFF